MNCRQPVDMLLYKLLAPDLSHHRPLLRSTYDGSWGHTQLTPTQNEGLRKLVESSSTSFSFQYLLNPPEIRTELSRIYSLMRLNCNRTIFGRKPGYIRVSDMGMNQRMILKISNRYLKKSPLLSSNNQEKKRCVFSVPVVINVSLP